MACARCNQSPFRFRSRDSWYESAGDSVSGELSGEVGGDARPVDDKAITGVPVNRNLLPCPLLVGGLEPFPDVAQWHFGVQVKCETMSGDDAVPADSSEMVD